MDFYTQLVRRTCKSISFEAHQTDSDTLPINPIPDFGTRQIIEVSLTTLLSFCRHYGSGWELRVLANGNPTGLKLDPGDIFAYLQIIFYDNNNDSLIIRGILEKPEVSGPDAGVSRTGEKGPSDFCLRLSLFGFFLARNRNDYFKSREKEAVGVRTIDVQEMAAVGGNREQGHRDSPGTSHRLAGTETFNESQLEMSRLNV